MTIAKASFRFETMRSGRWQIPLQVPRPILSRPATTSREPPGDYLQKCEKP
jgi:hypothetical protein